MAISNLNLSSSVPIVASINRLKANYNTNLAWLPLGNQYISDTFNKLKNGFSAAGSINSIEITDYISSSIGIHCFNSWSYLSAAIGSYLDGDFGNSIHNAYYAELRAIMSFLAAQGIGVFDQFNVIVDNAGGIHKAECPFRESRTHSFAKTALDQWLNETTNTENLLGQIKIEGFTMKDWFDATSFSPTVHLPGLVAANWMKEWSLDITQLKIEQELRNFVSYRPQTFIYNFSRRSDDIKFRIDFVRQLWELCAPTNRLDLSLLRNALELLYKSAFGYQNLQALDVNNDFNPILTDLGVNPNDFHSQYIIQFLRRSVEPQNNKLFELAKFPFTVPIKETDTEPVGIISRACLLALFTTKVVENVFQRAGVLSADLQGWYNNIGVSLGYWSALSPPYLYSDLWQDIELDLNELNNWIKSTGAVHDTYNYKIGLRDYSSNIKHLAKSYIWSTAI